LSTARINEKNIGETPTMPLLPDCWILFSSMEVIRKLNSVILFLRILSYMNVLEKFTGGEARM
jgi:hypothetical protein